MTFLVGASVLSATEPSDYERGIQEWRTRRVERLTAPDSWLVLVGRHPLKPGENRIGSAAHNSVVLASGPSEFGIIRIDTDGSATFSPAEGSASSVDGKPLLQPIRLVFSEDEKPTFVSSGTVTFHLIERGGTKFLRVRDSECVRRKHFAGIDSFPVSVAWRIEARWLASEKPVEVPVTNILGMVQNEKTPGKAVFEWEGKTYELLALDEGADAPLFFIFGDLTNGEETYGMRFLYAERPRDGKVVLDFNKAYNPPCAFTPFATCPLPPAGNRLRLRIDAGEKNYRGQHD